jgi:hypothetical protein
MLLSEPGITGGKGPDTGQIKKELGSFCKGG